MNAYRGTRRCNSRTGFHRIIDQTTENDSPFLWNQSSFGS
jgi:hypothetical protein